MRRGQGRQNIAKEGDERRERERRGEGRGGGDGQENDTQG